jgi:Domain of unknown function (DUF6265)
VKLALLVTLSATLVHGTCATPVPVRSSRVSIAQLRWLAGHWRTGAGDSSSEERWTSARDGVMNGLGRTLSAGVATHHELLRIVERDGAVRYIAAPDGQRVTEFSLTEARENFARFANEAHDFPKWIEYRREGDALIARVGGDASQRSATWTFRLVAGPATARSLSATACASQQDTARIELTLAPCSCGASLYCAELRGATLSAALIEQQCDACESARGRCVAPVTAARLRGADGGCEPVSVEAIVAGP